MPIQKQRRVVVLGFSFVGKTAISLRFCADRFHDKYEPTYENSFRRVIKFKGQDVDVTITDTQGQDEQELFRNEYCLGAHAYVLVFSVTSPRSLQNVKVINEKLINLMGTRNIPRVLVGNKQDLDDRRIPLQDCIELANDWGCPYIECSAKQNVNVDEIFRLSLQEIDRFSDDDISSSSWVPSFRLPALSLPSSTALLTMLTISCLLCGVVALGIGVWFAALPKGNDQSDVVAYVMFIIGLMTTFCSVIGLLGVFQMRREYIRTFSFSFGFILLAQWVMGVGLYFTMIPSKPFFWTLFGVFTVLEIAAIVVAVRLLLLHNDFSIGVDDDDAGHYISVTTQEFPHFAQASHLGNRA